MNFQNPQNQFSSIMATPPLNPSDPRSAPSNAQRGPVHGAVQLPPNDPTAQLQHQFQAFNFGAGPGSMDPALSRNMPQAGQWNSGGAQQPQQQNAATPGMPFNNA